VVCTIFPILLKQMCKIFHGKLWIERKKLNSDLNHSMIKASNSFTAAKGSVPLLYNIITPTSLLNTRLMIMMNYMQLKTENIPTISSKDAIKRKNENGSDRPNKKQKLTNLIDDTPQALNGMEIIIVVHTMPYFTILFKHMGNKTQKNGKGYSKKFQSISFYTAWWIPKYLRGVSTLEAARDSVWTILYEKWSCSFSSWQYRL